MLIDTHSHINSMVKESFDTPLTFSPEQHKEIALIIQQAKEHGVEYMINVGTSLVESNNCVALAQQFSSLFATVGIHPNDCTTDWKKDFQLIEKMAKNKETNKIVAIGECGLDRHRDYDAIRQADAFKAHIELALTHDLALVVHSRDAYDETLKILEPYAHDIKRAVMHCFSYDTFFAQHVIAWDFFLGIGGTITYPKNNELRTIVQTVDTTHIVLETDAPFLPPQIIRGKKNHPLYIQTIAQFIADLREISYDTIAQTTTANAVRLFNLNQKL